MVTIFILLTLYNAVLRLLMTKTFIKRLYLLEQPFKNWYCMMALIILLNGRIILRCRERNIEG